MLSTAYYFLQVVFCSAVMMGYYWLVLRDKKFHQYNRFYLMSVLLLSWIIPLIKIQWTKPVTSGAQVINFLSIVADNNAEIDANLAKTSYQFTWEVFAIAAYFLIAAIMLGLLVVGLVRLYVLLKKHSCKNVGDVYLILTQVKGTPFSFFRYIFWHEAIDLRSDAGKKMLEHELTHVQQKHSVDKVLIQVVLVAGWFNPFFWLLKKEMEMIHEFIADNKSVQNGDSASLAQLLLTAAYPQQQFLLTTPFFFSPIKRRLAMITNNKNPRFSYLRRLVILPLLAIVVVLFAFRSKGIDHAQPLSVGTLMETVADKIKGNQTNPTLQLRRSFNLNKNYIVVIDAGHGGTDHGALSPSTKVSEAELALQFAKAVKAANTNSNIKIILTRETDVFNSVQEKADFANAQKADLFISLHCNDATPIQHENGKKEANPSKGMEIYIANKEKAVNYNANAIFANELANSIKNLNTFLGIKSRNAGIWVLQAVKCPSVIIEAGFMTNQEDMKLMLDAGYQKKFAAGLLEGVQSYLASTEQNSYKTVSDNVIVRAKDSSKNNSVVIVSDSIIFHETGKTPLIILDGQVQPNADVNKINPSSIEKIEVLKNESATVLYGDAGKNGVIMITSKAAMKESMKKPIEPSSSPIPKNTVYYVDGVKVDSSAMRKIERSNIATVNIWKGEKAMNKFGVDEGIGVIEITTLKASSISWKVGQEKVQIINIKRNVFANVNGNSTVYFGDAGKSSASTEGITDLIVVDGKLLSPDELNSKYKSSDFITGGAIDPKTVNGKTRKGVLFLSSSSINLKDMLTLIEKVLAENGK
ncbi:MAG: N-acetylmuramoyl-L-alanine amidase [Bacteroidetes bacterium]|nr:N-acetylmuramoyl-L-alanine amidase [Bacteroidota bacterium]